MSTFSPGVTFPFKVKTKDNLIDTYIYQAINFIFTLEIPKNNQLSKKLHLYCGRNSKLTDAYLEIIKKRNDIINKKS